MHVYLDGTVLVTHGGTEMGQGLHTKVCQIVAHAFDIGIDKVRRYGRSGLFELV